MKPKHVFWGLFLVMLGTLILLSNLSLLNIQLGTMWKFWPLVIILWGISYIIKTDFVKFLFAGVAAIILALSIYGAGQSCMNICNKGIDFEFADGDSYSYADTTRMIESFEKNIKHADLKVDAGAGIFKINEATADLVSVVALGDKSNYILTRNDSGDGTAIEVRMKKAKFKLQKGHNRNRIDMNLNPNPIWNMNFDLGAAEINFDLSPYKVSTAKLDVGAASLELKLGDKYPETIVDVDAGASSIKILIPDSSGCEIKSDVSLSSKHFKDFRKINSDLYRTENFDTAKNKIYLRLDAAVSSVEVKRYSNEW